MNKFSLIGYIISAVLVIILSLPGNPVIGQNPEPIEKKIFIYGGGLNQAFLEYIAQLTGKVKPKICYLPTAAADNPYAINRWYQLCSGLNVEPHTLRVWINSPNQKESWKDVLDKMDAIVVGGGNTLNMIAIWKAQEIDLALKYVYEKGAVLAGGSAGSLCWFEGGTTDSRPKELTIVKGLGFLNYSHCPHYNSEEARRPLYHENILTGKLSDGYACDDNAGLLFVDGRLKNGVSMDENNNSYFVFKMGNKIVEEKIESRILK